jgi:hypothetical protein
MTFKPGHLPRVNIIFFFSAIFNDTTIHHWTVGLLINTEGVNTVIKVISFRPTSILGVIFCLPFLSL